MTSEESKKFESLIVRKMLDDGEIADRLVPYLTPKHFNEENRVVYSTILEHLQKYEKFPSYQELRFEIRDEGAKSYFINRIENETFESVSDEVFLFETETFVKEKLYFDAVFDAREAFTTKDLKERRDKLSKVFPKMMEAESFCFNNDVGLDPLESIDRMLDSLQCDTSVISSGIKSFDNILSGGFPTKELSLLLGETSIGKTLTMCAFAVSCMKRGYNVLYATHEMRDAKIGERIVANLIDLDTKKIREKSYRETVKKRTAAVKTKYKGSIKIKEYPTSTANTNHIMVCIKDLEKKQKWKPDIIFVDSVNIMLPNVYVRGMNSDAFCMAISTDLRRMAFEVGCPVVSCMQLKREGFNSSNIEITDVAGSISSMTVAGVIVAITQPEEMKELKRYALKTLKVRDEERYKTCYVNVDYPKMRLTDCEQGDYSSEQPKIVHTDSDVSDSINLLCETQPEEKPIQSAFNINFD